MLQEKIMLFDSKTKDMLSRLYPGENAEQKYRKYKNQKIKAFFVFLILGIGTCISVYASSRIQGRLQEGTRLQRSEWGEGNYEVILWAITEEGTEEIIYEVQERKYTEKELDEKIEQLTEDLPEIIRGQNESLVCVRSRLYLPESMDGYPFAITWKSSDYGKVRTDGTVDVSKVGEEGEEVLLTAQLFYEEQKWQRDFRLVLYPEQINQLQDSKGIVYMALKESDERSEQQGVWILPDKVGEQDVIWEEKIPARGIEFLLLGLTGAVMAVYAMDNDIKQKMKKRKKELAESYPEFISKLQLYIGAGLSVRNAFFRIGSEYKGQKQDVGRKSFLYEEILLACHKLSNGVAEEDAYRDFAKRCDEIHYRKLAFLLISYGRQGNDNILKQLAKEGYVAWEEKRSEAKKRGEEAGTKLLFPMILMLVVVMFLILIPAYTEF